MSHIVVPEPRQRWRVQNCELGGGGSNPKFPQLNKEALCLGQKNFIKEVVNSGVIEAESNIGTVGSPPPPPTHTHLPQNEMEVNNSNDAFCGIFRLYIRSILRSKRKIVLINAIEFLCEVKKKWVHIRSSPRLNVKLSPTYDRRWGHAPPLPCPDDTLCTLRGDGIGNGKIYIYIDAKRFYKDLPIQYGGNTPAASKIIAVNILIGLYQMSAATISLPRSDFVP